MDKLPLVRVAEVAFLTGKLEECMRFYKMLGLELPAELERLNFADVGEQLFGFCDESKGFIDGHGGFTKTRLHVAFEIPAGTMDECVTFLNSKGVETSPKNDATDWHGAATGSSVYFTDPAGNIMELWCPETA